MMLPFLNDATHFDYFLRSRRVADSGAAGVPNVLQKEWRLLVGKGRRNWLRTKPIEPVGGRSWANADCGIQLSKLFVSL